MTGAVFRILLFFCRGGYIRKGHGGFGRCQKRYGSKNRGRFVGAWRESRKSGVRGANGRARRDYFVILYSTTLMAPPAV